MKNIKVVFSKNLKKYRKEKHLSQEKLSLLSDIHRTYISGVEQGNRNISLENIEKLANALDIEAYRFLMDGGCLNDGEN